jgi:hypothetical protein
VAGEPGEQAVILAFDAPQTIRQVILEVEETEVARTQELDLASPTPSLAIQAATVSFRHRGMRPILRSHFGNLPEAINRSRVRRPIPRPAAISLIE